MHFLASKHFLEHCWAPPCRYEGTRKSLDAAIGKAKSLIGLLRRLSKEKQGAYATLVNRQMSRADSRDNIEALSGGAAKRG